MGTATAQINSCPDTVFEGCRAVQEVDSLDWLGGARSIMLNEEVVDVDSYGKTLTLLSIDPSAIHDSDDLTDFDEEDDLIENWTPRFRK